MLTSIDLLTRSLVAHGKMEQARKNIAKLHNANYDVDGHLADIKNGLDREQAENETAGLYNDCFNKANWRRTLATVSTLFIQNACGNSRVIGYMSCEFLPIMETLTSNTLTRDDRLHATRRSSLWPVS